MRGKVYGDSWRKIGSMTVVVAATWSLVAMGCHSTQGEDPPAATVVQVSDFAGSPEKDQAAPKGEVRVENAILAPGADPPEEVAQVAREEEAQARAAQSVGPPAPGSVTRRVGQRVVVDSLIGQVNGRPIYANEVLDPIADELWAEARRLSLQEFQAKAMQAVTNRLRDVILNELFLSEAQIGLSKEQQTGLLGFLRNLREELVGQGGGVQALAERRMQEAEGLTLDEKVDLERNKMLIGHLLQTKIGPRVVVSWRDIQREYQRRNEVYNPKPKVTLGRIQVRTEGNEEQIATIQEQLAAGKPFMDVAKEQGARDDGRWDSFLMGPGGIADIEIADEYKDHLAGLEAGQSAGPFARGSRTVWIHVISISQDEGKSLFSPEVQTELRRELYQRRYQIEQNRYVDKLMQQGVFDEIAEMAGRVMEIVIARYVPQQ